MIYDILNNKKTRKIAILIDPDKQQAASVQKTIASCEQCHVDLILVGGSLDAGNSDELIKSIKVQTPIPIVLFPGSLLQLSDKADGIFLLSLISGRNPEYLIGNHVQAAPMLKKSKIEVISVGYILIESGRSTSVQYMSNTMPIPADKPDIAVATAIAGEMLGLKAIYLEAGSGAQFHVPEKVISAVKEQINIPLIVGGGIRTKDQLDSIFNAGADLVVIGNSLENNPAKLFTLLS